ncbi:hypothetical protein BX600DRAFT_512974 [Xylariales sp. PMI_506]|nr:hypothetical protein BX600DRAFT_512974 [Xylariales sp. PMI_506]
MPEMENIAAPAASQASSHFALEPVSGAVLHEIATSTKHELARKGPIRTGCREIDEDVLINGLERGCVVGVSAEEVNFGLLLAMQTIAHSLVSGQSIRRAAIVTTLAAPVLLPMLRDIIKAQVEARWGQNHPEVNAQVRWCLEHISISRVFDIEGLCEVLDELEVVSPAASPNEPPPRKLGAAGRTEPESSPLSSPLSSPPPSSPITALPSPRTERSEIRDSEDEDEDDLSSSPPVVYVPPTPPVATAEARNQEEVTAQKIPVEDLSTTLPDIVLVTHFSNLLSTLFAQRERSSAHTTLQLLSCHLRYLSRSSGSLFLLLNSTTSTPAVKLPSAPPPGAQQSASRPLDPSLRSIFNPPPPSHVGYSQIPTRRNKPSFGLTFTQFLDLHLLSTQVPRSKADAEALFAPMEATSGTGRVRYAWAVEVLLDENGSWAEANGRGTIINRERRWGAVEVRTGGFIIGDAFMDQRGSSGVNKGFTTTKAFVRLAAGFGGPRV